MDSDDVARQSSAMQRRDRVVHSVSRRRARETTNARDDGIGEETPMMAEAVASGHLRSTTGEDHEMEGPVEEDSEQIAGGLSGSVEEDDPNTGQYVNYQIGFTYVRKASTTRKGWGLHVLVSTFVQSGRFPKVR